VGCAATGTSETMTEAEPTCTRVDGLNMQSLQEKKPFQFRLRTLFVGTAVLAALLTLCSLLIDWISVKGPVSYRGFKKIKIGMDLESVEAILGPGCPIPAEWVTRIPGSPFAKRKGNLDLVIDGEQFYLWENEEYDSRIELGFRDGKVCDVFYSGLCL